MSLNTTTLSAAIGASDTSFTLGSTTGITAGVSTTGSGVTYLLIESEMVLVTAVPVSGYVQVTRGQLGTQAVTHSKSTPVLAGLVSDFPQFTPGISTSFTVAASNFKVVDAPVAAAATLTPSGRLFHVTGHTASSLMNLPTGFVGGDITIIADDTWTWTSSTNAQGFAQAGAVTSAGSAVTFYYDPNTLLWYASRNS